MKKIKLTQSRYALVDDEDYESVSRWKWTYGKHGYAYRNDRGKKIYMHRLIMDAPDNMEVNHRSGNGIDNQRGNLQVCFHSSNLSNRGPQKNNTSGYKGVTWHKQTGKWLAQIVAKGRMYYLGLFVDIEDAARAYNEAALLYHGDFAYLNEVPNA